MNASLGKCWKKKRTAGFEWMDVSSLVWVSVVFVCKKLLTLCRFCQASLNCHSAGKNHFLFAPMDMPEIHLMLTV